MSYTFVCVYVLRYLADASRQEFLFVQDIFYQCHFYILCRLSYSFLFCSFKFPLSRSVLTGEKVKPSISHGKAHHDSAVTFTPCFIKLENLRCQVKNVEQAPSFSRIKVIKRQITRHKISQCNGRRVPISLCSSKFHVIRRFLECFIHNICSQ